MQNILVTSNSEPDMDGVACAIVYADYLTKTEKQNRYEVKFGEGLHVEGRFVLEQLGLKRELLGDEKYEGYIVLDTSAGDCLPSQVDLSKVIEIIDHRLVPQYEDFPNAKFRVEPVGAAATQVAEFFYFNNVEISSVNAQLLLCAMYSNTVNFKADTTTFRDLRMKKWLEEKVEDKNLYEEMFKYKTEYTIKHLEEVLNSDAYPLNLKKLGKCGVYQLEMNNSDALLERKDELDNLFKVITPDTSYNYLIIQNIIAGNTTVYAKDQEVYDLFKEVGIPGEVKNGLWHVGHLMMRKSFLKFIKA